MKITKIVSKEIAILELKGNFLCEPDKMKLRKKLYGLMNDKIKNVVVDLGNVECMNSEGLGTLVMALTSLRKAGGDLRLARVTPMVQETLAITQLSNVFATYETAAEAIASFKTRKK